MPSSFVEHYAAPLNQLSVPSETNDGEIPAFSVESPKKDSLRSNLATLAHSSSLANIQNLVSTIDSRSNRRFNSSINARSITDVTHIDDEEDALERAVMSKLVISLYSESLDTFLKQSLEIEDMAEWWARIERSGFHVAWYLLQSE